VLLHLYQPIESGLEELGKVRPNEGMMYLGANFKTLFSFSFLQKHRRTSKKNKMKN